jgi:polyisoprenoid-binding protein YceI
MKEKYLEVQKFPQSKLHLTDVALPTSWTPATPTLAGAKFKGDLTLHGVTKPIEGTFDVSGAATAMNVKAAFTVMIDQYGVEIPKYLGITVKNDVPVSLTMHNLKSSK